MRKFWALFLIGLGSWASAMGSAATIESAKTTSTFKVIHVKDLVAILNSGKQVAIYDVNVESTRRHLGTVPGAKLLSSSSDYDVAKELPSDKKSMLVFYCANTRCAASHAAAKKAIEAGYSDVSVMVDGIYGWRDAGQRLEKVLVPARSMTPQEVTELLKTNEAVVFDVRENEERHEVIDQAQWMPMSKVEDPKGWNEFKSHLPDDKIIILHCAAGMRSRKLAERLAAEGLKAGYFKGPDEWRAAGLPLKKGPAH